MATLDDIVSVDIHLNTTGVGRANFGTIMVFSRNTDYVSGKAPAPDSVATTIACPTQLVSWLPAPTRPKYWPRSSRSRRARAR